MKQNRWAWYTLGLIIVIGLAAMIWTSVVAVANVWFMVGLAFLIGAAFFILEKGHLFAGWRRRRRKNNGPLEMELPEEKIKARDVATVKNGPIIVNRYARFCLINAVGLILFSILLTL